MEAGDLLLAFDLADAALKDHPDDVELQHLAALSLARAGASERALQLFRGWRLDRAEDSHIRALEARLAKDRALALDGEIRNRGLVEAAELYLGTAGGASDPYHLINAASLYRLAGRPKEAARLAMELLPHASGDDYWSAATRAEAFLLLGRRKAAAAEIGRAASAPDGTDGARASTRRQLRLLLAAEGLSTAAIETLLQPLAPAATMLLSAPDEASWRTPPGRSEAAAIRSAVEDAVAAWRPGALFTLLASASEVLFAEAAAAAGAEVTVVLPATAAKAAAAASKAAGSGWARRLAACCRHAARVVEATDDPDADHRGYPSHARRLAAGLAELRARHVDGEAIEVVLTSAAADDEAPPGAGRRRALTVPIAASAAAPADGEEPHCHAIVFADFPGFSRLSERLLARFWEVVMAAVGEVVKGAGSSVIAANTWGDGVHLVVADARSAAEICLQIQRRLGAIAPSLLEQPEAPAMRIGVHYGPVRDCLDPVTGRRTFFGRALSRAARIEPVTPPGTVYGTEAFAAILLLEAGPDFACTYVGRVPLAKGYGAFRMYKLAAIRPTA
jgi:hypothetical protein